MTNSMKSEKKQIEVHEHNTDIYVNFMIPTILWEIFKIQETWKALIRHIRTIEIIWTIQNTGSPPMNLF